MTIQPSALLDISGERWRVQSRHQDTINGEMMIGYICVKDDELGELRVFMSSRRDWQSEVVWICEGESYFLQESSVTVYASLI